MQILTLVSTMRTAGFVAFCTVLGFVAAPAVAQDGNLTIQLNKVENNGGSCRMTYVINNGSGQAVAAASYEMAVYGKDDAVMKLKDTRYKGHVNQLVKRDQFGRCRNGLDGSRGAVDLGRHNRI